MKNKSFPPGGYIPKKTDGEVSFPHQDYITNEYKKLTAYDVMNFAKALQMRPPSKLEDLAKLFRPYLRGKIHAEILEDGKMPVGVIINRAKIDDVEFMATAIYSLDKYFNIRWLTISDKEADAVTFVFIENHFYFVHNTEMMNHITSVQLYQLYDPAQL